MERLSSKSQLPVGKNNTIKDKRSQKETPKEKLAVNTIVVAKTGM